MKHFLLTVVLLSSIQPLMAEDAFESWRRQILKLNSQVEELKSLSEKLGLQIDSKVFAEHWEVLVRKAQIENRPVVIAFLGMSNSGKSTVFNMLTGRKLTSVSSDSGFTRAANAVIPKGLNHEEVKTLLSSLAVEKLSHPQQLSMEHSEPTAYTVDAGTEFPFLLIDLPDVDTVTDGNKKVADAGIKNADVVFIMADESYKNRDLVDHIERAAKVGKKAVVLFNKARLIEDSQLGGWEKALQYFGEKIDVIASFAIPFDMEVAQNGFLNTNAVNIGVDGKAYSNHSLSPLVDQLRELNLGQHQVEVEKTALEEILSSQLGLKTAIEGLSEKLVTLEKIVGQFDSSSEEKIYDFPNSTNARVKALILDVWNSNFSIFGSYVKYFAGIMKIGRRYREHEAVAQTKHVHGYVEDERKSLIKNIIEPLIGDLRSVSEQMDGELKTLLLSGLLRTESVNFVPEFYAALAKDVGVEREVKKHVLDQFKAFQEKSPQIFRGIQWTDSTLSLITPLAMPVTGSILGSFFLGPLAPSKMLAGLYGLGGSAVGGAAGVAGMPVAINSITKTKEEVLSRFVSDSLTYYQVKRLNWTIGWLKENYFREFFNKFDPEAVKKMREASANVAMETDVLVSEIGAGSCKNTFTD